MAGEQPGPGPEVTAFITQQPEPSQKRPRLSRPSRIKEKTALIGAGAGLGATTAILGAVLLYGPSGPKDIPCTLDKETAGITFPIKGSEVEVEVDPGRTVVFETTPSNGQPSVEPGIIARLRGTDPTIIAIYPDEVNAFTVRENATVRNLGANTLAHCMDTAISPLKIAELQDRHREEPHKVGMRPVEPMAPVQSPPFQKPRPR